MPVKLQNIFIIHPKSFLYVLCNKSPHLVRNHYFDFYLHILEIYINVIKQYIFLCLASFSYDNFEIHPYYWVYLWFILFLLLRSIPLTEYAVICLFILLLMGILDCFQFGAVINTFV